MSWTDRLDETCPTCESSFREPPIRACRTPWRHACGKRHGRTARCELARDDCKRQQEVERADQWKKDPSKVALRADEVVAGLERFHRGRFPSAHQGGWALFSEFRCGTGFRDHQRRAYKLAGDPGDDGLINPETRIDLYAVNLWPSKGCHLLAYEVKVSRSDFLSELKHPEKRAQALRISTEFYFATPQGLVQPDEIPEECGLVEVRYGPRGRPYTERVVAAPVRELGPIHWRTFAAMAARATDPAYRRR